MTEAIRVAVLISSDKGARGEREDLSGPAIVSKLQGLAEVLAQEIVPDEKELIIEKLITYADELKVDIVFTSLEVTDRAMLSRAVAGIRGRTLIINLPGSPKAVRECLDVFLPVMDHAVETLRGEAVECAKQPE